MEKELLALDEKVVMESARTRDKNGFLQVKTSNLTRDHVAPYYGREIPGWEERQLDPDRIYYGWRNPDELKAALSTFNGVPLLIEHKFDSAEHPNKELRVGTVGTSAKWEPPYITNALSVWDEKAISAIEDGTLRDLSCGYRYKPDFTPGETPDGLAYDFVMRELACNHVALVHEGRAPYCYVSDEKPRGITMSEETKVDGACDDFTEFARKTIDESGVELTPEQKDALVRAFAESHAKFEESKVDEAVQETEGTRDEEPAKPEGAEDADEPKDEAKAEDSDEPKDEPKPEGGAMDAALIAKTVRGQLSAQYRAATEVKSVLGNVDPMAYDSADAIYLDAVKTMGVKNVPASAAKHVFAALQSVKTAAPSGAMDSAPKSDEDFLKQFIR
jgi:hypothetical protein